MSKPTAKCYNCVAEFVFTVISVVYQFETMSIKTCQVIRFV